MIAKNGQLSDVLKHVHFVSRITFLKVFNNHLLNKFGIIFMYILAHILELFI
jgi:hypothetical protein